MIVKMKEVLLFISSVTSDDALYELGKLGIVQIKDIQPPTDASIEWCKEKIEGITKTQSILENYVDKKKDATSRKKYLADDPEKIINNVLRSVKFKQNCLNRLQNAQEQLNWYKTWGENVHIKDIKYLEKKGMYVRLYKAERSFLEHIPDGLDVVTFSEEEGMIPIALFTRNKEEELLLKQDKIPDLPFDEAKKIVIKKKRQLAELDVYLSDLAEHIEILHHYHEYMNSSLEFRNAFHGMGNIEGSVRYLRGFIPKHAVESFKMEADENNWGYQIKEPDNPDEVPVFVKNPKWISIINPVLKFVDIIPGYKEVDISIFFLMAFALFFAMLIGDAGYGALFLLLIFIFRKKIPSQMRVLAVVLSGATIVWGVLSGTYFGAEQIAKIPVLSNLVIENISSFGVDNISFMMHLSFLIGAIHLTLAHSIRIFQFSNSTKAISEIGWVSFIWGLFFLAEMLVLRKEMPGWSQWLFIAGLVLVALFSKEDKNLIKSALLSLANLPLSLINGFSDVVSYVRLFAVGLATAVVASSFNDMAIPAEGDMSILNIIIAAIALFLGHALNIILALMAVMVHGIRLNLLEFAGHLGIQFSGEAYKPFKLK